MRLWTQAGVLTLLLAVTPLLTACERPDSGAAGGSTPPPAATSTPAATTAAATTSAPATETNEKYRGLEPFPDVQAPAITEYETVRFQTDAGDIVMEIYPQAAPNAAKRFLELVQGGFYDDTPVFRVVTDPEPFVAQFGVNWRAGHKDWQEKQFKDDPSLFVLAPGTLAFAKAGPDTNSTQVFINYRDNSMLRGQGFTTFGRIVKGYDIAQKFKSVGDPGMGLDQGRLWEEGDKYLESLPADQKPSMIEKAEIVKKK